MTASEEHFQAAQLLIEVLYRVLNPAEHADIEAWIDLRSEYEGGFLWLANTLGWPPLWFSNGLRLMLEAPPRKLNRLRKQLLSLTNADREA